MRLRTFWIPESLRGLPRRHAIKIIEASVNQSRISDWLTGGASLVLFSASLLLLGHVLQFLIALPICVTIAVVYWFFSLRIAVRTYIERHTVDGRLMVCIYCKYDLYGSRSPDCPECGKPVAVDPGQAPEDTHV